MMAVEVLDREPVGSVLGREPARPAVPTRRLPRNAGPVLLLVLVALLVGLPLAFLILGSVSQSAVPGEISLNRLGFANYVDVWLDPATYTLFTNTFIYVAGATGVGLTLATSLAWLVERSNIPGKIWIYAGVPMTLAMPGMLQAMAWVLLLSPHSGFINQELARFGIAPIGIYSLGGMIFVEGLRLVPTAFLMLVPLLRSMDPTLEEAAAMSGARPASTLRKITMRLMLPGLLSVAIYQAMTALEVFEVPGILGLPADIHVFSTKIYAIVQSATFVPVYGKANALSMIYLLIALLTTAAYTRVVARQERFMIVTGKGYRPRRLDLGRWRIAAVAFVALFLTLSMALPLVVFAYVSLLPFVQFPSWQAVASMSLDSYRAALSGEFLGIAVWNTLLVILATAAGTLLLSFLISMVAMRTRFRGRRLLDQLAFVPHAIPGIVLGLAFMWVFLEGSHIGIGVFGSIWSIAIAFTVSYIAYGTRAMNAAILQIHRDLEEAAHVCGAPPPRTLLRVFLPLMRPTFVGVGIWVMLHVVRSASLPLLLYQGNDNQVLAVLIWNQWNDGDIQSVSAIGVMTILALMAITMLVRFVGFGRDRHIQEA